VVTSDGRAQQRNDEDAREAEPGEQGPRKEVVAMLVAERNQHSRPLVSTIAKIA
jgi:hypothetical protein